MPVGIITGASRGLGLALARALDERGWRLVVDARDARGARRGDRRAARRGRDCGRRRRARAPPRAGRGGRRRGSTCWSTTRACSAPARSRRSPTTRSPSCGASTRSTCSRRWRSPSSRCRACAGGGDPRHHLRRGGRAVRRLGRVRLVEGRARAADRDPRRRAPAAARLRGRSGRHANADAAGGVPGRRHLGPPGAGGERPGLLALIEGSLPSGRYSRSSWRRRMTELALAPVIDAVQLPAHAPRPRGAPTAPGARPDPADVGLLVASRSHGSSSTRGSTSWRASSPRRPARRQHLGDPAGGAAGAARRAGRRAAAVRARPRRGLGGRAAHAGPAAVRAPPIGARLELPGGAHASCSRVPGQRPPGARPPRRSANRSRTTCTATAARSATTTTRERGRSTPTRRSSRSIRGAPRCRAPRGRSRRAGDRARRARRADRARDAARRGLVARARRAALPGALPGSRPHRPARNAVHGWGGRVIAVGTTVVRALETVAEPGGAVSAGEGSTDLIVGPRRAAARGRRAAHRLARARLLAPRPARGGGGHRAARALLPLRPRPRLPLPRVRRRAPDPAVTARAEMAHRRVRKTVRKHAS